MKGGLPALALEPPDRPNRRCLRPPSDDAQAVRDGLRLIEWSEVPGPTQEAHLDPVARQRFVMMPPVAVNGIEHRCVCETCRRRKFPITQIEGNEIRIIRKRTSTQVNYSNSAGVVLVCKNEFQKCITHTGLANFS